VDLFRDTLVPKARQSLKATEAAFRAGNANFVDLVDAERVLLEFQLSQERALADQAQHVARLEMLVGRPMRPAADGPAEEDEPADAKPAATVSPNPDASKGDAR